MEAVDLPAPVAEKAVGPHRARHHLVEVERAVALGVDLLVGLDAAARARLLRMEMGVDGPGVQRGAEAGGGESELHRMPRRAIVRAVLTRSMARRSRTAATFRFDA
ncbi:hypothetical protein mvi_56080 [Methylobacterium indicum]|uniref:Uncharacterized protein n=1 Tax=Methylobacterium indicum TaxID=1775910 RepID=A0A8H8X053_9HYPH|nr:hypothetical protein mvi_56080 [Methylobacterium indicum]